MNTGIIFFLLQPNVANAILPTSAVSRMPLRRHRSLDWVRVTQNMPFNDARTDLELILCVIRCTKKECHLGHSEFKISPKLFSAWMGHVCARDCRELTYGYLKPWPVQSWSIMHAFWIWYEIFLSLITSMNSLWWHGHFTDPIRKLKPESVVS